MRNRPCCRSNRAVQPPNVTPSLCYTPWGCLVLASNHGDSLLFPSALPRPKRPSQALKSEMRQRLSLPNRNSAARKQLEKRIAKTREQLYRDVSVFVTGVMRDLIRWEDVVQERLLLHSVVTSDATVDDAFDSLSLDDHGLEERERPVAPTAAPQGSVIFYWW